MQTLPKLINKLDKKKKKSFMSTFLTYIYIEIYKKNPTYGNPVNFYKCAHNSNNNYFYSPFCTVSLFCGVFCYGRLCCDCESVWIIAPILNLRITVFKKLAKKNIILVFQF